MKLKILQWLMWLYWRCVSMATPKKDRRGERNRDPLRRLLYTGLFFGGSVLVAASSYSVEFLSPEYRTLLVLVGGIGALISSKKIS